MALTLTYSNDAFPKDQEFDIPGVGLVVNGKATKLTEEQEMSFHSRNEVTLKEATKDMESMKVEGTAEMKTPDASDTAPPIPGGEG